jgi:hypothetical protein
MTTANETYRKARQLSRRAPSLRSLSRLSRLNGARAPAVQPCSYCALLWHVPIMPLYWLLVSAAAYRALWQFMTARFEWEKTEHGSVRAASDW